MSKESDFLIYCMERYRYFKGLSGADVAKTFDEYGIYRYITRYFESLHTMEDHCIVQDSCYSSNGAGFSSFRRMVSTCCFSFWPEVFSLLMPIGIQKGGIKVKQHHLRMSDGIDGIPHRLADLIELAQGSFIHAVPEHRKKDRRL